MEVFFYYHSDQTHIFEGSRHDPIERQPEDILGKEITGFKYDDEGNLILTVGVSDFEFKPYDPKMPGLGSHMPEIELRRNGSILTKEQIRALQKRNGEIHVMNVIDSKQLDDFLCTREGKAIVLAVIERDHDKG